MHLVVHDEGAGERTQFLGLQAIVLDPIVEVLDSLAVNEPKHCQNKSDAKDLEADTCDFESV